MRRRMRTRRRAAATLVTALAQVDASSSSTSTHTLPSPPMSTLKSKRLKGVVVDRPFVYGSVSSFESKSDDQHNFKWSIYLRGLENEDLSYFIKRVTFRLHESFDVPVRNIDVPPYQVDDGGWGEFTVAIVVHFHDAALKPVELSHFLKLFPDTGTQQHAQAVETRQPVVSEKYDEFVFADPSEDFHAAIVAGPRAKLPANPLAQLWTPPDRWADEERKQLAQLSQVHETVLRHIAKAKQDMMDLESENASFRQELAGLSAMKAAKK